MRQFMKLIFNKKNLLSYLINFFFAVLIASIPIFSFDKTLYLGTWIISGIVFILMIVETLRRKKILFDIINVSMLIFCVSSLISTLLNGFRNSNLSPVILIISTFIVYTYSKTTNNHKNILKSAYVGIVIFLFFFVIKYRSQIISLDTSTRLGGEFGDENDIAILIGLGFVYSLYLVVFKKKSWKTILYVLLLLGFGFSGFFTGSKIYILIIFTSLCTTILIYFGRSKIWISLIAIVSLIIIGIFILSLPSFATIRERFKMFFDIILNRSTTRIDYSTYFRIEMFEAGFEMFFRKPVFGFGIWGFAKFGGLNKGWSHNHISEGLCNFGIIGFLLFHVPVIQSLINFKNKKNKKDYVLPILVMIFFITSMLSVALYTQKIFAFVIGSIYSYFENNELMSISFEKKKIKFDIIKKKELMVYENNSSY